ncbi:MAG TPA: hypothetical protein VFV10_02200 [Gammaproteobacteria bacterium]|nr:hypothetical protein [Gammaproteobacteria bacterium]
MALQSTTKTTLNYILTLVQADTTLSLALYGSSQRLLDSTGQAAIKAACPLPLRGASNADALAALDALLADVAAN